MVKLCDTKYDVSPELIESITSRLTIKLQNIEGLEGQHVVHMLNTLYPAVRNKPWYKDFILHFCSSRRITVRQEHL